VVGAGVIGLLMLGIAGSLNFINYKKRAFKIVLKTAGGEVTAYKRCLQKGMFLKAGVCSDNRQGQKGI
jgi:hypothetical protein